MIARFIGNLLGMLLVSALSAAVVVLAHLYIPVWLTPYLLVGWAFLFAVIESFPKGEKS